MDLLNDEHNVKKKKSFEKWLKRPAKGVKPLFFPDSPIEDLIEKKLKDLLKMAIVRSRNLHDIKDNITDLQIDRIIVHGTIPHFVWSRSETYRPIYFFFGDIDGRCKECSPKNNYKLRNNPRYDDPLALISPMWKRKVIDLIKEGHCCWPETFLVCPDLPRPDKNCLCREKEGTWSIRDILALSRLRIPRWAIRKREMLKTPGASVQTKRNSLELFGSKYFKEDGFDNKENIVTVALRAHLKENPRLKTYREDYLNTFASDALDKALLWDSTKREPIEDQFDDSEFGSSSSQKVILVQSEWKNAEPPWEKGDFHWLGAENCAFLSRDEESNNLTSGLQGMYGCEDLDGHLLIYFEVKQTGNKELDNFVNDKKSIWIDDRQLFGFCNDVLLPWARLFREADKRWENRQNFNLLFPKEMRIQLLGKLKDVEKRIDENKGTSFTEKLDRIELFYKRRAHKEEDEPVQLALSAMSDVWSFAFGGDVLKPHYFEFQRFQQLLKGVPDYRDHLTHSIEVFLVGNKLIQNILSDVNDFKNQLCDRIKSMKLDKLNDLFNKHLQDNELALMEERIIRFQWALAALMHDFAIPAEKFNELVNHMFQTFLGVKAEGNLGSNGIREVINQEQPKYRTFLYALFSKTESGAEVLNSMPVPILSEFAFQRLTEDHGFLSAVYLFNQLFERTKTDGQRWWRLQESVRRQIIENIIEDNKGVNDGLSESEKSELNDLKNRFAESLILEVLDAIVKHNAFAKEYRLFFHEEPSFKFPSEFFSGSKGIFSSPIPGLLLLCDTLCDWGRTIHPDELHRHEPGSTEKGNQSEIARPECMITKMNGKKITVTYKWRLPYQASIAEREWCLKNIYSHVRKEMRPYVPGFTMWEGCRNCNNGKSGQYDECKAFQVLKRFWSKVVACEEPKEEPKDVRVPKNRLRFPKMWKQFNEIDIDVYFYDNRICKFILGEGVKP